MGITSWILLATTTAAGILVALYLYRRWEAPGRGRGLLAALRGIVLALLLLLITDPDIPAPEFSPAATREWVLLDGSLSMALPAEPGSDESRWDVARELARQRVRGRDVVVFGVTPRLLPFDSVAAMEPAAPESRLVPAIRMASEAGARRVTVVTDGGIDDAADAARLLPELGVPVEVLTVGHPDVVNVGIAEVDAPGWAASGDSLTIEVGVVGLAATGQTVNVTISEAGRTLDSATVQVPEPGRVARVPLSFLPASPEDGGLVRYDVRVDAGDAVPDDNARSVYVHVSADPPGVALVSFRPDWEPRFLLPVLEQALGLPTRGYLRGASDRYVRVGEGRDAGRSHTEAEVRRAAEAADVLVLHGVDNGLPGWVREVARTARKLIVFPASGAPELDLEDLGVPLTIAPPAGGEWYALDDVPPSPVAPLLTPFQMNALPPVVGVRVIEPTGGAWAPLTVSRDRRGLPVPAVLAGERQGTRWVVALADGFWQWAFRGGESRQVYRHLWGAVAGWLVRGENILAEAPVRPVRRTVERGRHLEWVAPGLGADSVHVVLTDQNGATVADTAAPLLRGDTAVTVALPPGHYHYTVRALTGDEEVARSEGPLTVETYSPEYARAPAPLPDGDAEVDGSGVRVARATVPLHTTPWPYLLLVVALCAEWILRRRWGLR